MQKILGLSDLIRLLSRALPPTTGQVLAEFLEKQPELFVGGCQMKCGALEMLSNQASKTQSNGVPSSTYEWLSNAAAWFYTQNVASFDFDFANVLVKLHQAIRGESDIYPARKTVRVQLREPGILFERYRHLSRCSSLGRVNLAK